MSNPVTILLGELAGLTIMGAALDPAEAGTALDAAEAGRMGWLISTTADGGGITFISFTEDVGEVPLLAAG